MFHAPTTLRCGWAESDSSAWLNLIEKVVLSGRFGVAACFQVIFCMLYRRFKHTGRSFVCFFRQSGQQRDSCSPFDKDVQTIESAFGPLETQLGRERGRFRRKDPRFPVMPIVVYLVVSLRVRTRFGQGCIACHPNDSIAPFRWMVNPRELFPMCGSPCGLQKLFPS